MRAPRGMHLGACTPTRKSFDRPHFAQEPSCGFDRRRATVLLGLGLVAPEFLQSPKTGPNRSSRFRETHISPPPPHIHNPIYASRLVRWTLAGALLVPGCDEADGDPLDQGAQVRGELDAIGGAEQISEADLVGGSTTDDPSTAQPDPEELGEDAENTEPAPVAALLVLEGDVTVEFIDTGEGTIGILVGGPINSAEFDAVAAHISVAGSPLELFSSLSSVAVEETDAPDALVDLSMAVMSAGNWGEPVEDDGLPPIEGVAQEDDAFASDAENLNPQSQSADSLMNKPKPQAATCDYLNAWGDQLHHNAGNCALYWRDDDETTNWWYDDIIAFAGHVIVTNGVVLWNVKHRNCNVGGCSWYTDHTKVITEGYHYYYARSDNNNDHRSESVVESFSEGGSHYHDVARIHDWHHRVIFTSSWDQAHGISYNGSRLYCTDTPYEGPDPNNIATGSGWQGSNQIDC